MRTLTILVALISIAWCAQIKAQPIVERIDKRAAQPPAKARRTGVFVGIDHYKDARVSSLQTCVNDAKDMAELLRQRCPLDDEIVLLDDKATRQAIENLFQKALPARMRSEDVLVLYWSGHSGRCQDKSNDEPDGFDEFLLPYDGRLSKNGENGGIEEFILDDEIGKWLRRLPARHSFILIDTAHSGGFVKDLARDGTAILTACAESQLAMGFPDLRHSVFTHFLLSSLQHSDDPQEIGCLYPEVRQNCSKYVQAEFPGRSQTPVLLDSSHVPFLLGAAKTSKQERDQRNTR